MNLNTFNKIYSLLINHIDHDERKSRSKQPISNTLVIACRIRYLAEKKLRRIERCTESNKVRVQLSARPAPLYKSFTIRYKSPQLCYLWSLRYNLDLHVTCSVMINDTNRIRCNSNVAALASPLTFLLVNDASALSTVLDQMRLNLLILLS